MKSRLLATLAVAAPLLLGLGGCSLAVHDRDDHDLAYYPDRYQRNYYRSHARPVYVAPPPRAYYGPPRHYGPRRDAVIVRPDGRRVIVTDRY